MKKFFLPQVAIILSMQLALADELGTQNTNAQNAPSTATPQATHTHQTKAEALHTLPSLKAMKLWNLPA